MESEKLMNALMTGKRKKKMTPSGGKKGLMMHLKMRPKKNIRKIFTTHENTGHEKKVSVLDALPHRSRRPELSGVNFNL